MEHPGVRRLHPDDDHFCIITGRDARQLHDDVKQLIAKMGIASSRAQGLSHVITTLQSFVGSDNTIYLLLDDENKKAVGFVKVGRKQLFLWDRMGGQHEMKLLCLLDFFTCPDCQRRGYGKTMIDRMLADQRLEMHQIPIDRPSALCLSFMDKRFGLNSYMPQSNNFVVFDQFWEAKMPERRPYGSELPPLESKRQQPKPLLGAAPANRPRVIAPALANRYRGRPQQHYNPITWTAY